MHLNQHLYHLCNDQCRFPWSTAEDRRMLLVRGRPVFFVECTPALSCVFVFIFLRCTRINRQATKQDSHAALKFHFFNPRTAIFQQINFLSTLQLSHNHSLGLYTFPQFLEHSTTIIHKHVTNRTLQNLHESILEHRRMFQNKIN